MKVDLRKDQAKFRQYLLQRIKDYPAFVNDGPGDDEAPIQLITVGYYLEQTGYATVVFDTRPDAETDGEWTLYIAETTNILKFPHWRSLITAWYHCKPAELVRLNGKSVKVTQKSLTHGSIAKTVGEMLRDTMIQMRDEGRLRSLPLAEDAFLSVEEFDGHWSSAKSYKSRKSTRLNVDAPSGPELVDEESDEDRKAALLKRIRKLSAAKQIDFWISELRLRSDGKRSALDEVFQETSCPGWGHDCALDELKRIGKRAAVPLLELVQELAILPEWDGDRPKRGFKETQMQSIGVGAIWRVRDIGFKSNQIERMLHQIIRTACTTNAKRKLWGILPKHAADCLHLLFKGYPKPEWDGSTNRLLDAERFQS